MFFSVRRLRGNQRRARARGGLIVLERQQATLAVVYALLFLLLLSYLTSLLLRPTGAYWTWLDGWFVCGIEIGASGLCIAKGISRRHESYAARAGLRPAVLGRR